MSAKPTREEIRRWEARLEDREFSRSLLAFQEYVFDYFETLRQESGLLRIRVVLRRDDVKSLRSVVEKIARQRVMEEEGGDLGPPYDFDDVHDLVGVKILCPYQTDADWVVGRLFEESESLDTVEKSPEDGRRCDPGGYRGYNYRVYPAPGQRPEWGFLLCEIQIKTLLQEGWDAMTHDLVYKRQKAIPPKIAKEFANLSTALMTHERSAEFLRDSAEVLWERVIEHRSAAVLELMIQALVALNVLADKHPDVDSVTQEDLERGYAFTPSSIGNITEALRLEVAENGPTPEACFIAGLIALHSRSRGQMEFAIQLADKLVASKPEQPRAEIVKASVNWALGRHEQAVDAAEQALEKSSGANQEFENDFCFYISDARIFHTFMPERTIADAKSIATKLADNIASPIDLDTAGFAKIAFGENDQDVIEGMKLCEQARDIARVEGDAYTKKLAEVFCRRHIELGRARLEGRLGWWDY